MRVLHFTHTFAPQYGGTTTRLLDLLPLTGDEHYLYVPPPPVDAPANEDMGRLHVRRRAVPAGLRASRTGAAFARQLSDHGLDLVHGHNPPRCAWAALIASRKLRIPLVYEAHRLTFDSVMDQLSGPPWRHPERVARALLREAVFFYAAQAIIVQTPRHRERVLSMYPALQRRLHVVPVHVDTEWFDRDRLSEPQEASKHQLGFPQDLTTFLYCGHLTVMNGVGDLLAAVEAMSEGDRKRLRLVIVGRGPLETQVRQAAARLAPSVEYRGQAAFEQMPRYYAAADVVLAPARPNRVWDCNNPTKLLEAMSMRRAVLGGDVGGIRSLVRDGQSGFLYRAGDVSHLRETMVFLLDQRHRLDEVGDAARQIIINEHSAADCARRLREVYRQATAAPATDANP